MSFTGLPAPSRARRRAGLSIERTTGRTGAWQPWTRQYFPNGGPGNGWVREVKEVWSNCLYAVLVRRVAAPMGEVIHLAIRTPSNREPPWRDLQRIKNELFGPERLAVQVCPAQSRLIDAADMYHLWVLPEGHALGFGLHDLDEAQP